MSQAAGAERLGEFRSVKLAALVRDHWGSPAEPEPGSLPGGAFLRDRRASQGWVLIDDGSVAGFGAAVAWAARRDVSDLHVLVEDRTIAPKPSEVIARRADEFARPPSVWRINGRVLGEVKAAHSDGSVESAAEIGLPPADVLDRFATVISDAGARPIVEHGVLKGDVLGLEVARVVTDPVDGWKLAVGVGRHDREARLEWNPSEQSTQALEGVVGLVRQWRRGGAKRHPANYLASERWLRAALVARPELVGAATLTPVPAPIEVEDLRASAPAGAIGVDLARNPIVVVCSTGVDLDLVPTAADIRRLNSPGAELVLALPAADVFPVTEVMAGFLSQPARIVAIAGDWKSTVATFD